MLDYEIYECFHYTKEGCSSVASNQVGMEERGYRLTSYGFRIRHNGRTLYCSRLPFTCKAIAEIVRAKLMNKNEI